jgi:hypothetical protein
MHDKFPRERIEMCRLQHTESNPLKLVLTKPVVTYNEIYNALPYNYRNSPNIEGSTLMF